MRFLFLTNLAVHIFKKIERIEIMFCLLIYLLFYTLLFNLCDWLLMLVMLPFIGFCTCPKCLPRFWLGLMSNITNALLSFDFIHLFYSHPGSNRMSQDLVIPIFFSKPLPLASQDKYVALKQTLDYPFKRSGTFSSFYAFGTIWFLSKKKKKNQSRGVFCLWLAEAAVRRGRLIHSLYHWYVLVADTHIE